jgi:hypothetical protein
VEVEGTSASAISARRASFSYPAAIASIVDASASRLLSATLLASAAQAIRSIEVTGSSMVAG